MKKDAPNNALIGSAGAADIRDFAPDIAWGDHSILFYKEYCEDKDVLDIGCVMHNPENYRSKYWVHKALKEISKSLIGIDLYKPGVEYLREHDFSIRVADAQEFSLGCTFDVIVAGNIIEHLENLSGFIECCRMHLRPKGVLLVSTPNPWYWKAVAKAIFGTEQAVNPEHTMWLCPRTLRQLVRRHDMDVRKVKFGSRYLRDRIVPLPKGWKHTTFHAEIAFCVDRGT